jgi:hypothetical protein
MIPSANAGSGTHKAAVRILITIRAIFFSFMVSSWYHLYSRDVENTRKVPMV